MDGADRQRSSVARGDGARSGGSLHDDLLAATAELPFGHAVGFVLSQLGYAVTRMFKSELERVSLEPRQFGLMRAINASQRPSQQALGEILHIPASSLVALLDQLEERDLVRRTVDPSDRRVRLVELTEAGRASLVRAIKIAMSIESTLCKGFTSSEHEALIANLQRLAANMGLKPGVHPAADDDDDATSPEG